MCVCVCVCVCVSDYDHDHELRQERHSQVVGNSFPNVQRVRRSPSPQTLQVGPHFSGVCEAVAVAGFKHLAVVAKGQGVTEAGAHGQRNQRQLRAAQLNLKANSTLTSSV